MSTVVCLGEATVDMVTTVPVPLAAGQEHAGDTVMTIGGSACVMAAWLTRLGQAASLVASVGDDAMGQYIRAQAQRLGVRTEAVQIHAAQRTGATVRVTDQDGATTVIGDPGAGTLLTVTPQAAAAIESASLLIMSASTFMRPQTRPAALAALDAARAADTVVAVDTSSAAQIGECGPALVRRFLDQVDIVLGNDEEVAALTSDQPSGWLGTLPNLVIKHGAGGASWWSSGVAVTRRPSRTASPVDVSGAGDAFDAGVLGVLALAGELIEISKATKQRALESGAATAAQVCSQRGAWPR
jgi:sugar/nucleoside kinase (ribokinase family)